MNSSQPDIKSQIEWLVCLKMAKSSPAVMSESSKGAQMGFVCGYGVERVKIEVPALHHDDIVPPYVVKECEELIQQRRRKVVSAFQASLPVRIE